MSKKIVNLTLPAICEEVDFLFQMYPYNRYWKAFTNPDLRQELIVYILNHVPNKYIAVDENTQEKDVFPKFQSSLEQRMKIEAVAHQGIHRILKQNLHLIAFDISECVEVQTLSTSRPQQCQSLCGVAVVEHDQN